MTVILHYAHTKKKPIFPRRVVGCFLFNPFLEDLDIINQATPTYGSPPIRVVEIVRQQYKTNSSGVMQALKPPYIPSNDFSLPNPIIPNLEIYKRPKSRSNVCLVSCFLEYLHP
jgi:hypothetical protein